MPKNNNDFQKQQGDVWIEKIDKKFFQSVKKEKVNPQKKGFVLADGEATGHLHRIEDTSDVELFEYFDEKAEDTLLLFHLTAPKKVVHEEHGDIYLEPGYYQSGIVNEYDPFQEIIRKVVD